MGEPPTDDATLRSNDEMVERFRRCWITSTASSNLTLHGFRRFKTSQLLNLRFLEEEIADLDHIIYQAGLALGLSLSQTDRLGLRHSKRDENVPKVSEVITEKLILKLRDRLKQYNEALVAFNNIMAMETFSLIDDEERSSMRNDLNLYEVYKTRLLRVDLGSRTRTDPFQRYLHKYLRAFRYRRLSKKSQDSVERLGTVERGRRRWSYQNTILIADIIGRMTTAIVTVAFLVAPLAVLSRYSSKGIQLAVISACILVLSLLVTLFLKVTSFEMMAIAAAIAAVLSVFVSNSPVQK